MGSSIFNKDCRRCPRLATFLDRVAEKNPGYYCRPVPPFGDSDARLLIVGLAPGMHGANRTGRPFTGDYAGVLLYETLHKFGFASHPESLAADDPLTKLPNVILLPHIGSATVETRLAMRDLAIDNLLSALRGERPKAVVNPEVLS